MSNTYNKHLVIGTAGHIDHGKTTLVKVLTSIDTDRLSEEKKRGITIVLGYAFLNNEDTQISFVDVPGHEKFVKNMLAGATGMDAVMLIIAADEGVMPQTIEHLSIIEHLAITEGFIVLTKCDLVDAFTIEKRKKEIKDMLQSTHFAGVPIFEFSMNDSERTDAIKQYIYSLTKLSDADRENKDARMYIDRTFTLKGKGTIVTGTLIEGTIHEGRDVWFYPSEQKAKVKALQVHGKSVASASYGQRVAVNINLPLHSIENGMLLTEIENFRGHHIIDAHLSADKVITHWERIRFFIGTREVFGRIATQNQLPLHDSSQAYVQFRLEEEIYAKVGDRFILRRFSPVETIGGGTIENLNAVKHYFFKSDSNEDAVNKAFSTALQQMKLPFDDKHSQFQSLGYTETQLKNQLDIALKTNLIKNINTLHFLTTAVYESKQFEVYGVLSKWHEAHAYQLGMNRATLKSKCFQSWSKAYFDATIESLIFDKYIKVTGLNIATYDFEVIEDAYFIRIKDKILKLMQQKAFTLTGFGELKDIVDNPNHYDIFTYLNYLRIIVKIDEDYFITGESYDYAVEMLWKWFETNESLTVAQFRDHLDISRKASVVILEHFDAEGLTKRIDNKRILIKKEME